VLLSQQYYCDPLISNIEVITIYPDVILPPPYDGGVKWSDLEEPAMRDRIDKFISFITDSSYIDALSEYNATDKNGVSYDIGRGKLIASLSNIQMKLLDSDLAPLGLVKPSAIQKELSRAIQNPLVPNFPLPNPNRGYFVFLPQGVTLNASR
jgi:hypothetical protein